MGVVGSGADTHSRRHASVDDLVRWTRAVADADPTKIESTARRFGESRVYLAPVAWAAGTIVLLVRGVKLLLLNSRLTLIQVLPAAWIWLAMWDLKEHTQRSAPFRHITGGGMALVILIAIAVSIAAFWCNTVFAFAIEAPPLPRIRPAVRQTKPHLVRIVVAGILIGAALAFAIAVVPRINAKWVYIGTLGGVLGIMVISFVAVPARIIGRRPQKLPPKQAIGRTATGWALSGVAMAPGFILDRIGLIFIGVQGLQILGFVLLSLGTALYAAGMSSVKAVKMSIKFAAPAEHV